MDASEIKRLQQKKLKAILKFAYENVKFYHEIFDSKGLKPDDIKNIDDLPKLPVTTRSDIREKIGEMIATGVDPQKCKQHRTSGSTGIPIRIFCDEKAEDFRAAVFGFPFFECGLRSRDKAAFVADPRHFPKKHWYQSLGLMKRKYISASTPVEEQMDQLRNYRPDAIYAYPSWLYLLGKAMTKIGVVDLTPRLVFSTAETLDKPTRSFINSAFRVDMFDFLGCVEVERTAWECPEHAGYHMDIDSVVTEFIRDGEQVGPGERGDIVYTCLYNYAMPLIRYKIGDIGVPSDEKCPCGRGLPLIKKIEGRSDDLVQGSNGRLIVPEAFSMIMRCIPEIFQYQVVQKRTNEIIVRVVKGESFSKKTIQQVYDEVRNLAGEDIQVKIVIVRRIPKEQSGKFRTVISEIASVR